MMPEATTPTATEPMLLTVRDTARVLAVCEKTLWTLTRDGKLPAVRIGKRGIRYDRRDIERFIESAKGPETAQSSEGVTNGH